MTDEPTVPKSERHEARRAVKAITLGLFLGALLAWAARGR